MTTDQATERQPAHIRRSPQAATTARDVNSGHQDHPAPAIPLPADFGPAPTPGSLAQRKAIIQRLVERAQRVSRAGVDYGDVSPELEQQIAQARGGGKPLDANVGSAMSDALGYDVSGVNIHTDARANQLNRSLDARAFTVGRDVFFGANEYNPTTSDGRRLLAHELTHVVQQGAAGALQRDAAHDADHDVEAIASDSIRAGSVQRHVIQRHVDIAPIETDAKETSKELKQTGTTVAEPAPEAPQSTKTKKTGKKKPPELSFRALSVSWSHKAIKKKFGKAKTDKFITGEVTVVETLQQLYAVYDKWMQDHGFTWPDGTKWNEDQAAGVQMNGFAEPHPGTKIYVWGGGPDPSATTHEILHVNTVPGFVGKYGRVINEGITQRLALEVLKAAKESTKGTESTYIEEQKCVEQLLTIVPEATIIDSYFNNVDKIQTEYEKVMGKDSWAQVKVLLDQDKYTEAKAMMVRPTTPKTPSGGSGGSGGTTSTGGGSGSGTPPKKKGFFSKLFGK